MTNKAFYRKREKETKPFLPRRTRTTWGGRAATKRMELRISEKNKFEVGS